jgi:peptidoglycan hydrolase-like protein with peptidoglycan-binding domain
MSILKKGMRGAPVKRLQEKLGIGADGIFGPGTEKAVREFQTSAGLAADGIAGPDTFTAIGLPELVLLRVGTRGETVKKLQAALGVAADGRFGPATEKAVREFQAANGLHVDGLAGPETLAKLDAFPEVTEETVEKAVVQPDEEAFESEPMPEIKGVEVVTGSVVPLPEKGSVWSRVKGWFS